MIPDSFFSKRYDPEGYVYFPVLHYPLNAPWETGSFKSLIVWPEPLELALNQPLLDFLVGALSSAMHHLVDFTHLLPDGEGQYLFKPNEIRSKIYGKDITDFDGIIFYAETDHHLQYLGQLVEHYKDILNNGDIQVFVGPYYNSGATRIPGKPFTSIEQLVNIYRELTKTEDDHPKFRETWIYSKNQIIPAINTFTWFTNNQDQYYRFLPNIFVSPAIKINLGYPFEYIDWNAAIYYVPYWTWIKEAMYFQKNSGIHVDSKSGIINFSDDRKKEFIAFLKGYTVPVILLDHTLSDSGISNFLTALSEMRQLYIKRIIISIAAQSSKLEKFFSRLRKADSRIKHMITEIREYSDVGEPELNQKMVDGFPVTVHQIADLESRIASIEKESNIQIKEGDNSDAEGISIQYGRVPRKVRRLKPVVRKIVRIKYEKTGNAALLRHRDIIRLFDKLSRKANAPVVFSEGKFPRPKIAFSPPLGTGCESLAEFADFTVDTFVDASLSQCLNPLLPDGIRIVDEVPVLNKIPSLSESISRHLYCIKGKIEALDESKINRFESIIINRLKGDEVVEIDIKPFISEIRRQDNHIEIALKSIDGKTVKITEVIDALIKDENIRLSDFNIVRTEQLIKLSDEEWVDPIEYVRIHVQ
ncbi:MAG: hypothetical protein Kow00108_01560 [Calditrichia bacterium]